MQVFFFLQLKLPKYALVSTKTNTIKNSVPRCKAYLHFLTIVIRLPIKRRLAYPVTLMTTDSCTVWASHYGANIGYI